MRPRQDGLARPGAWGAPWSVRASGRPGRPWRHRGDCCRGRRGLGSVPPPAPLTQLQEPALPVWVEERVRQVVAIVLGNLERLVLDALVQVLRGGKAAGAETQVEEERPPPRRPPSTGPRDPVKTP